MDMVNIFLFIVLAAVAVLLAFAVLHLAQSRRHEERLLNRSAHTLARLIASKTRLSHLLHSSFLVAILLCGFPQTAQSQTKFCTSYADYKAGQWKPYEELIPGKEPDSIRVKYDGQNFILKTSDKEVNKAIKQDVFMMQIDKQLFINQRPLRDEDGGILPVNNYLRALPYKGDKLLVVSYKVTLGDVLDLVNIGLDVALLATGHTTWGTIFLATDLLLTNSDLMEHHVLYLIDKEPNAKGKYIMTRLNDAFMEKLLRDDPVTFEQYYGRQKKGDRQSASNILPILVKKGLIQDYHHKKSEK